MLFKENRYVLYAQGGGSDTKHLQPLPPHRSPIVCIVAIPQTRSPEDFFNSQLVQFEDEITSCQAIWMHKSFYSLVLELKNQTIADRLYNVSWLSVNTFRLLMEDTLVRKTTQNWCTRSFFPSQSCIKSSPRQIYLQLNWVNDRWSTKNCCSCPGLQRNITMLTLIDFQVVLCVWINLIHQ